MSNEKFVEGGLIWSPLFNASRKEIIEFINALDSEQKHYKLEFFVQTVLEYSYDESKDEDFLEATKSTIFEFTIELTSFAYDVLTEDEYKKASETYKRGQLNSGALKALLDCFLKACSQFIGAKSNKDMQQLLWANIKRKTAEFKAKRLEKSFGPLKKVVDEAASGVKAECFFKSTDIYETELNCALNEYLIENYGYDFNKAHKQLPPSSSSVYEAFLGKGNELLQLTLINDKEFWKKKSFFVISFINHVLEKNSERHAQKLLNYIFSKLTANARTNALIKGGLSLGFYDKQSFIDTYSQQFIKAGYSLDLLYPLVAVEEKEEKCKIGKGIFDAFLYDYVYPNSNEQIRECLSGDLSTKGYSYYSFFDTLNFITISLNITGDYEKALKIICPEFFLSKALWERVYLRIYETSKMIEQNKLYSYLFEHFYDLFSLIESHTGIETAIQLNTDARDRAYDELKGALNDLDVKICDSYKFDYVVSLLDRKSAKLSEAERFPVLEQLGDAIYGFALSEMIFYTPNNNDYEENALSPAQRFEGYACARGQIKIAKKYGIDKMYISVSYASRKRDYDLINSVYDLTEWDIDNKDEEKYLADALEMVLGTVALDKGYATAISLAKEMIKSTFEGDFENEVRYSHENVTREDIDKDYFRRILPGLYSSFREVSSYNNFASKYLNLMYDSLLKLLACLIFKTEGIEERRFISYGSNAIAYYFEPLTGTSYEVTPLYYCYLREGLDRVIELYKDSALEKYNQKNKK